MSEPVDTPADRRDPNYVLSQEEFHRTIEGVVCRELAGERALGNRVDRQVDGLRKTAGWMAVSAGFWFLFTGFAVLTRSERGRP